MKTDFYLPWCPTRGQTGKPSCALLRVLMTLRQALYLAFWRVCVLAFNATGQSPEMDERSGATLCVF